MSRTTLLLWVLWVWALLPWHACVHGMRRSRVKELREETEHMFYHGFENYMRYAFPEDELRPVTCGPLTRDRENPAHIELNDVLGNYSLTLVDSLSTLAVISSVNSSSESEAKAWRYFQNGVRELVELYGDGSEGPRGKGVRGNGFELDSKVQVFETVIRGLGGLLSAHLFAVGDLPIRGYSPPKEEVEFAKTWDKTSYGSHRSGIRWDNGFVYDGQLLRLAMDLGKRLLPAFYTPTGLPYPRVNLQYGVPFYANTPLNKDKSNVHSQSSHASSPEITETCSAGAGSLVLEFTVLSRLTGDGRFEELAKRAFWAVWMRRSNIDLIGAGIDAESGMWIGSYTGIGAGIDSFFEYALKSYILLSEGQPAKLDGLEHVLGMGDDYKPLPNEQHSSDAFLRTWQEAHNAIKRHLYRGSGYQHPHYIQGDFVTGATRAFWIDSLSAYFPGLLTLAGDLDGATETHLLNAAVWTRFSALPERWNVATGDIEGGLSWWGGRPEFVESNYYLYLATKDPWYLYVGEMVMRDIKRRCWTKCGWAGLQDVRTGELSDRMESFFLGETAKYLYLLFEPDHPLNHLDGPFVFSTEGHPLIIPKATTTKRDSPSNNRYVPKQSQNLSTSVCPTPAPSPPLGLSSMAARPDLFHAANLARLHRRPQHENVEAAIVEYADDHPGITLSDLHSPSNYTYFPWTLPVELVPHDAVSAPMAVRPSLDLSFPPLQNSILSPASLERVEDGVLIRSISGLRLGMIQDVPLLDDKTSPVTEGFRIQVINNVPLGRDEKVYISKETTNILNPTDPNFTRIQDLIMLDIVVDVSPDYYFRNESSTSAGDDNPASTNAATFEQFRAEGSSVRMAFSSLVNRVSSLLLDETLNSALGLSSSNRPATRVVIPAITSTGKGAAPLPDVEEARLSSGIMSASTPGKGSVTRLTWSTVYLADEMCDQRIPAHVPRTHQVIVMKRGGCSFSQKLRNIPPFRPSRSSLQLVIVVSYPDTDMPHHSGSSEANLSGSAAFSASMSSTPSFTTASTSNAGPLTYLDESWLVRPLLDELQVVADGIPRPHPISMVMVGGGDETYSYFCHALGVGIRRRYEIRSQGVPISNLIVI
ncbi:hypothetical protein VTO42DRAFT_3696 [Malbranchea cinnamomea]